MLDRAEGRLAASLALIAGYVDGYGIVALGVYVSFMSGNTTQTGTLTGQGHFATALHSALSIVFFVVGNFAAALLTHSGLRRSPAPAGNGRGFAGRDHLCHKFGLVERRGRDRLDRPSHGHDEHHPVSGWRTSGKPHLCDGRLGGSGAISPWRYPVARAGRAGVVGYPSLPSFYSGESMGWLPERRSAVRSNDPAFWGVGPAASVPTLAYPSRARRRRSHARVKPERVRSQKRRR